MEERLIELRKSIKKTQKDLAHYLGVAQASYQRYENGEAEPNIERLIKLADYYHVTLDYLVGRKFGNDVGFLTKDQHKFISMYLKLNERYQERVNGRIESLYSEQNME